MTDHRAEAERLLPESRSEEAAQTHALLAIHDTLAEIRDRLPEPEAEAERDEWRDRHAALRADVEMVAGGISNHYGRGLVRDALDRDDERGEQA